MFAPVVLVPREAKTYGVAVGTAENLYVLLRAWFVAPAPTLGQVLFVFVAVWTQKPHVENGLLEDTVKLAPVGATPDVATIGYAFPLDKLLLLFIDIVAEYPVTSLVTMLTVSDAHDCDPLPNGVKFKVTVEELVIAIMAFILTVIIVPTLEVPTTAEVCDVNSNAIIAITMDKIPDSNCLSDNLIIFMLILYIKST